MPGVLMPEVSLDGLAIALSGSVPTSEELESNGWSELDFRFTVRSLVHAILDAGGRLVHGSHPSFVPFVETEATRLPVDPSRKRIQMLAIPNPKFFPEPRDWEGFVKRHQSYADVQSVCDRSVKLEQALSKLGEKLVEQAQAFVCIGGRGAQSSLSQPKPQVEAEVDAATARHLPVYLVGTCGGLSRMLYESRFKNQTEKLNNGLSEEDNRILASSATSSEVPRLILKGLRAANPPSHGNGS